MTKESIQEKNLFIEILNKTWYDDKTNEVLCKELIKICNLDNGCIMNQIVNFNNSISNAIEFIPGVNYDNITRSFKLIVKEQSCNEFEKVLNRTIPHFNSQFKK